MKTLSPKKIFFALALAVAVAGAAGQAGAQPVPPPDSAGTLPPDIAPSSPLAEVIKLAQAGVDVTIIKNYIATSASTFNLDAEKIIYLNDAGVPTDVVNAMMDHDKNLFAATATPPPMVPVNPEALTDATMAPPPPVVDVNYFNNSLSPYGSWVNVDGYGRCWRPTVVIYDSSWRPYCDRGHWVYTDYGWYWDSDYSWGATFHYGRWFNHPRFGWCWWPDTDWASSWVTWRSSDDYCGWAPLPPFAVFRPGVGFFYRGASVSVGFDFGLNADCFTFVSPGHFSERHPRYYRVEPQRVAQIFHQTTVVNHFDVNRQFIVNNGISAQRIGTLTHRDMQPVHVGALPNATRQGWRGDEVHSPAHGSGVGEPGGNGQRDFSNPGLRHGPVLRDNQSSGNGFVPAPTPGRTWYGQNGSSLVSGQVITHPVVTQPTISHPVIVPPANHPPTPGTPFNHDQQHNDPGQMQTEFHGTQHQFNSPVATTTSSGASHWQQNQNHPSQSPAIATPPPMQPRQFNQPVTTTTSPGANRWQQNQNLQPQAPPVVTAPPVQQRQFTAPVTPPPTEYRQQHNDNQQAATTAAPHNNAPATTQPQVQVHAQSQQPSQGKDNNWQAQNH